MNPRDIFALVPKTPAAIEKAEPGTKRVLSGMVADALALVKKEPLRNSRPLRVVMVNDEPVILQMLEIVIRSWFQDVTMLFFENGATALEELSQADPDLLITDDRMAGMDGDRIVPTLTGTKGHLPNYPDVGLGNN